MTAFWRCTSEQIAAGLYMIRELWLVLSLFSVVKSTSFGRDLTSYGSNEWCGGNWRSDSMGQHRPMHYPLGEAV